MPKYETKKTRHTPLRVVYRDRLVLMHGEPLCQKAASGPGTTTAVDVYVNCEACLRMLAKENA